MGFKGGTMEELLNTLNDIFENIKRENLSLYGSEYLKYTEKVSKWDPYKTEGYIDEIYSIPYEYFMTVERCVSEEDRYFLATYSPCPLPLKHKVYMLNEDHDSPHLHRHDYYEIIYVCDGHRDMQVENQTLRLNQHDICIFDTMCAHLDKRTSSEGTAFYCCLTKNMVDSYFITHLKAKRTRDFFITKGTAKNDVSYLKLHADNNASRNIEKALSNIFTEMESALPGYDRICQANTLRALNEIQADADANIYTFSKRLNGSKLFQAVAKYINSNISDISIEKLCAQFHYQEDYYSRLIKKNTGLTYAQYVRALKIDKAKNLLVNTDMTTNEILMYLGYQCHSYFYKAFREETGLTPSQYRRKNRDT